MPVLLGVANRGHRPDWELQVLYPLIANDPGTGQKHKRF
jgi:hypothetical protein